MNDISFRSATRDDINDIMIVEKNCFAEGVRENQKVFEERIEIFPEGFIVITSQSKIIGYACGEIWSNEQDINENNFTLGHMPSSVHNKNGSRFYISSMGIVENMRGGGKGKVLFETLVKNVLTKFPKIKELILIVNEEWLVARKIYEKEGFSEIMRIKDFFKPKDSLPTNGIVMLKKI